MKTPPSTIFPPQSCWLQLTQNNRTSKTCWTPLMMIPWLVLYMPCPSLQFSGCNTLHYSIFVSATCHVSSRKINTFDDVEYSVPLSTCYAILAKDCSSEPSFVVMMRKLTESTELKEIKIISRSHKVVFTPESDSDDRIKVNVNDRDYPLTEDIEMPEGGYPVVRYNASYFKIYYMWNFYWYFLFRISKEGSQVKVELLSHGVTVYFDGYATNIEVSNTSRITMWTCFILSYCYSCPTCTVTNNAVCAVTSIWSPMTNSAHQIWLWPKMFANFI